jgi:4-amino-4-deoxy-L-arabinose transferase-like glycosyltransferase
MCLLSERARKHLLWALLAGLAVRLFFVWRFPATSGDTRLYEQLAYNWLDHGIFGLTINGQVVPVDLRTPGYPAFLAIVSLLFGRSQLAILLAQAVLDLGTCVLTGLLAAALAPTEQRERVAIPALWLAATCPFVANYCAVPLTEVLATFFTAAAVLWMVKAVRGAEGSADPPESLRRATRAWLLAGLFTGLGTLTRPETPLLLVAAGAVFFFRWRRSANWPKLARAAVLLVAGCLAPLLPWGARNWITFHRVQFLASRYAEMDKEFVPRGFYDWTKTWLWRFRDVYAVMWKYDEEIVPIEDIPSYAFDTPDEEARVAALLEAYNDTETATPEFDRVFAQLAAERTARHPLRTYISVPVKRALALWFTPRVELLAFSGHLTPVAKEWDEDRLDFSVTLCFFLWNAAYIALALYGLRRAWLARSALGGEASVGIALLLAYLVVRTAFLTHVETPEPRYVIVCYPMVLALGALSALRPARGES